MTSGQRNHVCRSCSGKPWAEWLNPNGKSQPHRPRPNGGAHPPSKGYLGTQRQVDPWNRLIIFPWICLFLELINSYPPTPAFAKAGAAPGTTAGVELVLSDHPPKPSKHSPKPSKPSKHLPQQAPQGQGHFPNRHPRAKATAMAFYGLSKLPFARLQTLQTFQNLPNAPKPSKTFQTLQTPSPAGTPGPRPQQWLSIGFQSCRLPARKRSKRSKTFQTLQNRPNPPNTLQNPPNTFPNRHPRAKATSQTSTPGPRPQQWLSIGFQSCRLPARKHSKRSKTLQTLQNPPNPPNTLQNPPNPPKPSKPSKHPPKLPNPPPKPSKPSKHPPQQAPQGQGHFPNRHPRAKATA